MNYLMNWEINRGTAVEKPKNKRKDKIHYIDYKIMFIVDKELLKYKDKYYISDTNKYGKWVIK